jgi:hypothetical protein
MHSALKDDPNDRFELVSAYAKNDRYLTLRFDPGQDGDSAKANYFYTGKRCCGGFGYDCSREDAIRQFAELVAQEPVKLEHVAGEVMPDPFASCTVGTPMTTAALKRRIKVGDRWTLTRHADRAYPAQAPEARTIAKVQSDSFAALRDGHEDKRSNWVWMDFVKSERLRDLGDGGFLVLNARTGEPWLEYRPCA